MACTDRNRLTLIVAAAGLIAAACSARKAPPASRHEPVPAAGHPDDAGQPAVPIDAPAPAVAHSGAPWFERTGTLATELRTAARSIVLVEESGGLIARDAGGAVVRTLIAGTVSRSSYDARIGVLWFLRGGRLEAIDLGAPARPPIPVVEDMPDLGFDAGPGVALDQPACEVCVAVASHPRPSVRVAIAPPTSGRAGPDAARDERDRRVAGQAHPRLTAEGARLLTELANRPRRAPLTIDLGDTIWPIPRAAGDLDRCDRGDRPRRGCCENGCRRGFDLPALGWVLVVSGRTCDCAEDRCQATCVLHEPTRDRFARPSQPERMERDAVPEPFCHPSLDDAGRAYILDDHRVCTPRGCTALRGRLLGWLVPGPTTGSLREDMSACPEMP